MKIRIPAQTGNNMADKHTPSKPFEWTGCCQIKRTYDMTKYADVYKALTLNDDVEVFFTGKEVFNSDDSDYEIVGVNLVAILMFGVEVLAHEIPYEVSNLFLNNYADDDRADWEYV